LHAEEQGRGTYLNLLKYCKCRSVCS